MLSTRWYRCMLKIQETAMQAESFNPIVSFPEFVIGKSEEWDPCTSKTTLDAWDLLLLPETRGSFCITRRFFKTTGILLTL